LTTASDLQGCIFVSKATILFKTLIISVFLLLALLSSQAKGQLFSAIIGESEVVDILNLNFRNDCNDTLVYLGFIGPSDNKYFKLYPVANQNRVSSVVFTPQSTDTVTECFSFSFGWEPILPGCKRYEYWDYCPKGYGIKPDSLVFIRPKNLGFTLPIDQPAKRYYGVFRFYISNYTEATATIKDVRLISDSTSGLILLSIKDTSGNPITTIEPFTKRLPLLFEVESRLGPLKSSKTVPSSVQLVVSRLGKDSVFTNNVNLTLPARSDSVLKPNVKFDSVFLPAGVRTDRMIQFMILDSASNVHFDSLPYPFKITSVVRSDSAYNVTIAYGPSVSGTYTSNLKVKYFTEAFDGTVTKDSTAVFLNAIVSIPQIAPDTLYFETNSQESKSSKLKLPRTEFTLTESIQIATLSYPFRIEEIINFTDSCEVTIACSGTGGSYIAKPILEYPIVYFGDSTHVQVLPYRLEANIQSMNDSIFWEPTSFVEPNITSIQADLQGNIYTTNEKFYRPINNNNQWEERGPIPSKVKDLIIHDSDFFVITEDKKLFHSIDEGMSWSRLTGLKFPCNGAEAPVDRLFWRNDTMYVSSAQPCKPGYAQEAYLLKSIDNGLSWSSQSIYWASAGIWGIDTNNDYIISPLYGSATSFVTLAGKKFASNVTGVWNLQPSKWNFPDDVTGLFEAKVSRLFSIYDTCLIAATDGRGVFVSNDLGNNWYGLNGGLSTKLITSMTFDGERFWIGTTASGIYRSRKVKNKPAKVVASKPQELILFPNPVTDRLHFIAPENLTRCEIFNSLGNSLGKPHLSFENGRAILYDLNLPNGVYHLKIETTDEASFARFVVSR
jgi:hypothetical protein